MKFRYIDKYENWGKKQYYFGKKNGAKVEVYKKGNYYWFYIDREKDDFIFNSAWGNHTDTEQQNRLNNLPDMKFNSDAEALEFVEKWMDENVHKLKENKN